MFSSRIKYIHQAHKPKPSYIHQLQKPEIKNGRTLQLVALFSVHGDRSLVTTKLVDHNNGSLDNSGSITPTNQ